jgi:membrane protein YqaA with SNARE-associated domain
MFEFSAEAGLWGLLLASFVAATLLPGGSELVLLAVLQRHPELHWSALAVATLGNTAGAMTSYGIGRLIPNRVQHRAVATLRRHGYGVLLLSWAPLLGDALCVAAGWLRFNPWTSLVVIAAGKFARYWAVAAGWSWLVAGILRGAS